MKRLATPQALVIGAAVLAGLVVLFLAGIYVLVSWYVQANDDRWCSYFAVVTQHVPGDGDRALVIELRQAELEAGCGRLSTADALAEPGGHAGMATLASSYAGTPFEGFSLSHAAILNGATGAEASTVYGVRNGTISTDQGNFENTGDDVVLSEHFWINFANVTIEEGFVPFSTIALITGTTVTSSGAAGADYYAIPLWTLNSMNAVTQPLAIRVPSKDAGGQVRTLDFVLYRVQFQPFNFTGPSYKTGLSCSIAGRALFSGVNEIGGALPASYPQSIGRLVAWPGAQTGAFVPEPFGAGGGTIV